MKSKLQKLVDSLLNDPYKIFLVDGLGALLSAFLLGVVLRHLQTLVGLSDEKLVYLAIAPCFFAVYSFYCYLRKHKNWKPFLFIIAIANTVYCLITFSLLFTAKAELTSLGYFYFIVEIIIVMSLVFIEFKLANSKT